RELTLYTAGFGAVLVLDRPVYDMIHRQKSESLDNFAGFVQGFGSYPSFGIMGAFYARGMVYNDSRAKAVAVDAFASSFVGAGIITTSLKVITGRSRPRNGDGTYHFQPFSGDDSFPSGHTTQAFALASVIAEHYDDQWIDMTSYGIATLVGLARIEQEAHFPSDVVAGAIIGTVVGKSIVRYNKGHHGKYTLLPVMDGQTAGAMLNITL
ncbi:MAG: phosphatase PAP2 family protein, partial [Nitrospira sp.]|nr:phosphatase PAP2 family protein [Nitrospira sp.]